MNQDYNSRQRKIYNDYNVCSTDKLLEMLKNKEKYITDVIEVIKDILLERNAILVTAKERQLILDADFAEYYKGVKTALRSEKEIKKDDIAKLPANSGTNPQIKSEADLETEKMKYWKCPSCHELVNMELGV